MARAQEHASPSNSSTGTWQQICGLTDIQDSLSIVGSAIIGPLLLAGLFRAPSQM